MRFNYALTTLISFSVLFFINLDSTYSQEIVGEDERIIITVDSMERFDSFPEKYKGAPIPGYTTTYKPPLQGNDFVFIHITLVEKMDLKVAPSEKRMTTILLIDDKGNTHRASEEKLNITVPEKSPGYVLFQMPKDATPVQFKYQYQYREGPPEPQEIKIGQIDAIDIVNIQ